MKNSQNNFLQDIITKIYKNQKKPKLKQNEKFKDPLDPPINSGLDDFDYKIREYEKWIEKNKEKKDWAENIKKIKKSLEEKKKWIEEIEEKKKNGEIKKKRISEIYPNSHLLPPKDTLYSDYIQGNIGDCYLIQQTLGLSENHGQIISQIFPDPQTNDNGYYELMFFIDGEFQKVIVDDTVYVDKDNQPIFTKIRGKSNYFFPLLIEKAIAKICGGYSSIIGGWGKNIHKMLTGFKSTKIEIPANQREQESFKQSLINETKNNNNYLSFDQDNHEISIMAVDKDKMKLYNQHGNSNYFDNLGYKDIREEKSKDGNILISFEELFKKNDSKTKVEITRHEIPYDKFVQQYKYNNNKEKGKKTFEINVNETTCFEALLNSPDYMSNKPFFRDDTILTSINLINEEDPDKSIKCEDDDLKKYAIKNSKYELEGKYKLKKGKYKLEFDYDITKKRDKKKKSPEVMKNGIVHVCQKLGKDIEKIIPELKNKTDNSSLLSEELKNILDNKEPNEIENIFRDIQNQLLFNAFSVSFYSDNKVDIKCLDEATSSPSNEQNEKLEYQFQPNAKKLLNEAKQFFKIFEENGFKLDPDLKYNKIKNINNEEFQSVIVIDTEDDKKRIVTQLKDIGNYFYGNEENHP